MLDNHGNDKETNPFNVPSGSGRLSEWKFSSLTLVRSHPDPEQAVQAHKMLKGKQLGPTLSPLTFAD